MPKERMSAIANDFLLNGTKLLVTKKVRWARKLDTSRNSVFEVPLGTDEVPINGEWVQEGCNLTLTEVQPAGVAGEWWTFCFEAFGSLESAPKNLQAATKYAWSTSLPQPEGAFLSLPGLAIPSRGKNLDRRVQLGWESTSAVVFVINRTTASASVGALLFSYTRFRSRG